MLKAGALYLAIVIALLVAMLSASLIMLAYHYRLSDRKELRQLKLRNNLESATAIALLAAPDSLQKVDLFGKGTDSVLVQAEPWGIYELRSAAAFIRQDTLFRTFLVGRSAAADPICLYLSDEDRPLSVSGATRIYGKAMLPKAGVRKAYADGKPYTGEEAVYGAIGESSRKLPAPDKEMIDQLNALLDADVAAFPPPGAASIRKPFRCARAVYNCSGSGLPPDADFNGKVVLLSDTLLRIPAGAKLENTLVFARSIIIEEGFKGNCQLFARDSIIAGDRTEFTYPSVMCVLKKDEKGPQAKISLGNAAQFAGVLLAWEPKRTELQTLVNVGEEAVIKGEVWASGYFKFKAKTRVYGKVSCNRFVMQTPATLYENFLIDIRIDRPGRNQAYLAPALFKGEGQNQILKWLN